MSEVVFEKDPARLYFAYGSNIDLEQMAQSS